MNLLKHKTADEFIGLLLAVFIGFSAFFGVHAALVLSVTDTLSRQKIALPSNHDISFVTPSGVLSGRTISVNFPAEFVTTGMDENDVDISDNGFELTTATSCAGSNDASVTWVGNTVSFEVCTGSGAGILPGHTIRIKIGTNAIYSGLGFNRITNPNIVGIYKISISGSFGDNGSATLSLNNDDEINVTACVGSGCFGAPPVVTGGVSTSVPAKIYPPVISNIKIDQVSSSAVRVNWDTDQDANSFVAYGITTALSELKGNDSLAKDHSVILSGLKAGQDYIYKIRTVNIYGDITTSQVLSFSTNQPLDLEKPILSKVNVLSVEGNSAELYWETNVLSYWKVEYGRSLNYGSVISNEKASIKQTVNLKDLIPNTTYHYRIMVYGINGQETISGDYVFTTFDTIAPKVENLLVTNTTPTSVEIAWDTDKLALACIKYGTSDDSLIADVPVSTTYITTHKTVLKDLKPNTTYQFEIYTTDKQNNDGKSVKYTFKTPALEVPPNVGGLSAVSGDKSTVLSWINPGSLSFSKVIIVRNENDFPTNPLDGVIVYGGRARTVTDTNLKNDKTYYYTIWSVNKNDEYSSGAVVKSVPTAKPITPETPKVPVVVPPVKPPETIKPPITKPSEEILNNVVVKDSIAIGSSQLNINIQSVPTQIVGDRVIAMVGNQFEIVLPEKITSKEIKSSYISIGNDTYLLRKILNEKFSANSTVPTVVGTHKVLLVVNYADKTSVYSRFNLQVVAKGQIYDLTSKSKTLSEYAVISIIGENGVLWDGVKYNQNNPYTTGINGSYGFYLPKGRYSIKIEKKNFVTYIEPIKEYSGVINKVYNLKPLSLPEKIAKNVINHDRTPLSQSVGVYATPWYSILSVFANFFSNIFK